VFKGAPTIDTNEIISNFSSEKLRKKEGEKEERKEESKEEERKERRKKGGGTSCRPYGSPNVIVQSRYKCLHVRGF
jgi:hypothetical protein